MRTSREYTKNIRKGIVTEKMFAEAIFSYNKRAKNMRDQERKYRRQRYLTFHDYEGQYENKKEEYYGKKEELLKYIDPVCIHTVTRERREKIYDYEKEYKHVNEDDVIYENCYYDYDECRQVWFKVVGVLYKEFFLFYEVAGYSFHTPIKDTSDYPDLRIEDIGDLETYGEDQSYLMSPQMCDKIRNGLADGTLKIVKEDS